MGSVRCFGRTALAGLLWLVLIDGLMAAAARAINRVRWPRNGALTSDRKGCCLGLAHIASWRSLAKKTSASHTAFERQIDVPPVAGCDTRGGLRQRLPFLRVPVDTPEAASSRLPGRPRGVATGSHCGKQSRRKPLDGIHDLGGRQGFGVVRHTADEAVFHARWQARVFACLLGLQRVAAHNTDQFRHAVERIVPAAYLRDGYYGRWLGGLETLAVEAGLISQTELNARVLQLHAAPGAVRSVQLAAQPDVQPARLAAGGWSRAGAINPEARGGTARRPVSRAPQFRIGDVVRTQAHGHSRHTRLPAYARGRRGTIVAWHDGWVFPDRNAHAEGEDPQHLYSVEFDGRALWGGECEQDVLVMLDLFEPYLCPAEQGA